VSRLIRNPVHAGLVVAHGPEGKPYVVQGQHYERRLYDPGLFHQILARFGRDKAQNGRTTRTHDYLLGGTIRCGHCGRPLNGRRVDRLAARVYRCSSGSQYSEVHCTRNQERADVVEALVVAELRGLAQGEGVQQSAQATVEATLEQEQAAAQAELVALEKRLQKLWGHYQFWSGELAEGRCERDEYDVHVEEFRRGKSETSARIAELQASEAEQGMRRTVLLRAQQLVADFDASWEALSTEHRRELMQRVVESATMGRTEGGQTEVTFTIRGFTPVTRLIGRRNRRDRPASGPESLTPRQQVVLYLYAQGLDRAAIARRLGVSHALANTQLWQARRQLGVGTPEAAWELAREHVEGNLHWLPLTGRQRKVKVAAGKPLLTDAQEKLLAQLRQGLEVGEAAAALAIAESTAYVQLKNCRDRLGAASTEEAIRKAVDLGLIE
jgi:DNA-binding NarL/FixJ family response regulator